MADILKVYTSEQLYEMYRLYLIAKGVGLTDFNSGSKVRSLLESNSEIVSSISMDFKEGLYRAIPVALYEGFGFSLLAAVKAAGYIRPFRKPEFTIKYIGSGTAAKITSTSSNMLAAVTGAPGDAFSFAYATYPTIAELVTAINNLTNWEATLVKDGTAETSTLYQYTAKEVIGAVNYLYQVSSLDIMLATATAITITTGFSVTIDGLIISTLVENTILAGESGVQCTAEAGTAGIVGNIIINAVDTMNGKGSINSAIDGVEYVVNDAAFSGGTDAETEDERQTRFSETVNGLNAGTKLGIINAINGVSGVRSTGIRTAYPFRGANTIIVDTPSGTISAELLTEIEKVLYGDANDIENYPGKNCEGIEYQIISPTIVDVNIGITVYRLASINIELDTIKTAVKSAIEQYINTRKLGEDVILSEIVRVTKNAHAGVYDAVVTTPAANISIDEDEFSKTGAGTGGTVTVTMVISETE